jgi:hypothetical protein
MGEYIPGSMHISGVANGRSQSIATGSGTDMADGEDGSEKADALEIAEGPGSARSKGSMVKSGKAMSMAEVAVV